MKISVVELESHIASAWRRHTDAKNAKFIARVTVLSAMRSDGRFDAVSEALEDLKKWISAGKKSPKKVKSKGAIRLFDLNGTPGIAHIQFLTSELVSLSERTGIALFGIKNSSAVHTLRNWVEPIVEKDAIGIFAWNGGSYTTVPFGSRQPFFGTNPIAYAIPTGARPLIVDMATSEIPYRTLSLARQNKAKLGPMQGLAPDGTLTDDPNEVYKPSVNEEVRLLPMGGGYKGSAIMLLLEILTGALVGAKMSREASDDPLIPEEFGGVLLAINLAALTKKSLFERSVGTMLDQIRSSQPAANARRVHLPGDLAYSREMKVRDAGVLDVSEDILKELDLLAKPGRR